MAAPKRVEECVAIAIDRSGSMGTGFDEQQAWCDDGNDNALKKTLDRRTRMDAVKQVTTLLAGIAGINFCERQKKSRNRESLYHKLHSFIEPP